MQVRRLGVGDERWAARVVEEVKLAGDGITGVTVDPEYLRTFLAHEQNYLLGAFEGETPVGFILGYELSRCDGNRPMMFLYEIGVLESCRRRGIGRALLEELKRWCVARRCKKMFVPTSASNTAALALYRAAGGMGGPESGPRRL